MVDHPDLLFIGVFRSEKQVIDHVADLRWKVEEGNGGAPILGSKSVNP
jgi:hypothetical protein